MWFLRLIAIKEATLSRVGGCSSCFEHIEIQILCIDGTLDWVFPLEGAHFSFSAQIATLDLGLEGHVCITTFNSSIQIR
jgi:hypothetical protein